MAPLVLTTTVIKFHKPLIMNRITLLFLCLGIGFSIQAQNENYSLFAGFSPGGQTIQLKWLSKTPLQDKPFVLYRNSGGGDWVKITPVPVTASRVAPESVLFTAQNPFPRDSVYLRYAQIRNQQQPMTDATERQNLDFGLYFTAVSDNRMARHLGIYVEDSQVDPAQSYTYRLCVVEGGKERILAVSNTVSLSRKPLMAFSLKTESGEQSVTLSWQPVSSYFSYKVYRCQSATDAGVTVGEVMFPVVGKVEGQPTFTDNGLSNGVTYFYKVAGMDYFGNEWPASFAVSGSPTDRTAPGKATEILISRSQLEVQLRWKPATDADVAEQHVWRAEKSNGKYQKINSKSLLKNANSYTDNRLTEGASYYYYIETVDQKGNVSMSNKVSVTVPDQSPPAAPKGFAVRPDTSGRLFLSWLPNKEADIMGYRVYRSIDKDSDHFSLLQAEVIAGNSFMDKQPRSARNHFVYRLTAVDKFYNESAATECLARLPDVEPPLAPAIAAAEWSEKGVQISWFEQVNPDLRGYNLFRKSAFDSVYAPLNTTLIQGSQRSFTDRSAGPGQLFSYVMQAVDSSGLTSGFSSPRLVETPSIAGALPDMTLFANYDSMERAVLLTVRPKTPLPAGSSFSYVLQRRPEAGNWMRISPPMQELSYKDKRIDTGEVYYYRLVVIRDGQPSTPQQTELKVATGGG